MEEIGSKGVVGHSCRYADCFKIAGPAAWVEAQTALAVAMAFHELGTSAIRYGALSVPKGLADSSCEPDNEGNLRMLNLFWARTRRFICILTLP